MAIEARPFKVRCSGCHHVWTLATLPMEIMAMGAICKAAKCPSCGATTGIHVDTSNQTLPAPVVP